MAGNCIKMTTVDFLNLFFVTYLTLNEICKCAEATDGHSQAFIQTDNELRYLIDGVSIHLHENLISGASSISLGNVDGDDLHKYASPIRFQPQELDFNEHPVGMPFIEQVLVINPSSDTTIHMLSISGSTTEFHCSFFVDKTVPPGGNTTFGVVFLGRQEGIVENTLFIHTSLGSFKYQVRAKGVPNPYRLRPFLGVKMPLNSSYSPLINMHNPYSSTLQVTEMYSSAGDLHLELPNGEVEASHRVWEIPPFETKELMKASFVGRVENNHTAYIRIKTNSSSNDNLILPVEVEVSSAYGIYSPTEVLDFGVLRSQDKVKTLSLNLINYGQKHMHIQNIIIAPVNEALTVDFQPVKVPPGYLHSTQVATISFNPAKVTQVKQHSGKIVVKSRNTQFKLTIPYQVTMLQGLLSHDPSETKFYLGNSTLTTIIRNLTITNTFNISVIIHSVAIAENADSVFKIHKFTPVILAAGETTSSIQLELQPDETKSLSSVLRLFTNISFFDIPIVCYDGRLKKLTVPSMTNDYLEFGSLNVGEHRDLFIILANENPVDLTVKSWDSNFTKSIVEVIGVDKGNLSEIATKYNFANLTRSTVIKPNHYIVFRVTVFAPETQGISYGALSFTTDLEVIKIPFYFWSVTGSLNPDPIIFENAFPGKVSWHNIQIFSTFSQQMTVTSIETVPEDNRFLFEPLKSAPPVLKPELNNKVGKLYFDPIKGCHFQCYVGVPISTSLGQRWWSGMSLPPTVSDIDIELRNSLLGRWNDFVQSGQQSTNVTLKLNTNEVRGFSLNAQIKYHWPCITTKNRIKFSITQIGNETVKEFYIENPSNLPVITQLVMLPLYPNPEKILDSLQLKFGGNVGENPEFADKDTFTLHKIEQSDIQYGNKISVEEGSSEEYLIAQAHKNSAILTLAPGMKVKVRISFYPKNEILQSSVLIIRNNLTAVDAVILQGQGGYGQLKFGNKKPGMVTPLFFDMTEKHLGDCNRLTTSKQAPPNFTVKRAFTARNSGEIPVYIRDFAINGNPCEGFGFKVMNCNGFELSPNSSRKIDIAFTPDFTMSRVQRILNIYTSLMPGGLILNYSLIATIPPHLMLQCANSLPRPEWEPLLYYSSLSLMIFLLFSILVASYFESDRIFKYRFISMATSVLPNGNHGYDKAKVFDLKNMMFRQEDFRSTYPSSDINNSSADKRKKTNTLVNNNNNNNNNNNTNNNNNVCNNILNIAPGLFKRKKSNSSNWIQSSKTVYDKTSPLRDRDLCNNNISKSYVYEVDSRMDNMNKIGNNKRNTKRSATSDSVLSENNYDQAKIVSGESQKYWTSCNGNNSEMINGSENSEKERSKKTQSDEYDHQCSSNDKSKNRLTLRSTTPTKNELSNEVKCNIRMKFLDLTEDSSSSTTESSGADLDLLDKQGEMLHKVNKKKSKSKSLDSEKLTVKRTEIMDNDDDGDFELSTKSKAHRKVKVDHSKVFGGDILRPNTLELPYKFKTSVIMPNEEKVNVKSSGKIKKILINKTKGPLHMLASENNIKGKTAHLTEWDQPKPISNCDEAFTELAKQTEIFAQKLRRPSTDRSSSYSEVVIDGKLKAQPSPPSKTINPEIKKEFRHPGTIGQRLPLKNPTSPLPTNAWASSLLSPATPQTPPTPTKELIFPTDLLSDPTNKTLEGKLESRNESANNRQSLFGLQENLTLGSLWESRANWQDNCSTQQGSDDWNSFGMTPLDRGSVWNNNVRSESDMWSSKELFGYSPLGNKTSSSVNPILGPSHSVWSVWPTNATGSNSSAECISPTNVFDATGLTKSTLSPLPDDDRNTEIKENCSEFDPFRTPHDIWSLPTPLTKNQTSDNNPSWAFSLFSNKNSPN